MNTRNNTNESISILADGEATDAQIDAALAALATEEGRAEWALYHQIGDALRSDELALEMRAEFLPTLFARLEQEPAIIAPLAASQPAPGDKTPTLARRFALPGMVAAAAAAFALFGNSQLMVAQKPPAGTPAATTMLASATATPDSGATNSHSAAMHQGEVLRDPDIDQYLLAHQRFSPSPYSTAQFARSPAFATESEK